MFKRIAAAAAVFGMAALAPPVQAETTQAQSTCAHRDAVVKQLSKKFSESRIGAGLQGDKAVFELWTSEETGAWTLTRTTINGLTCVMAAGQSWTEITEVKGAAS